MSFDTEKARLGAEPFTFIGIVIDTCSLSYGDGVCTAGEVTTGTAQNGGAFNISLDASDVEADDFYNDMVIRIISGTGSGQIRTISDYQNFNNIAVILDIWATNPDATSVYVITNPNSTGSCFNARAHCQDTPNYAKTTKEDRFCQPRSSLPKGEPMIPVIVGDIKKSGQSTMGGTGLGKRAVVRIKLRDFPHHDRGFDPYVANRTYTPEEQGTFWGKWLVRNPYYEGRTVKVYYGYLTDPFDINNFEVQEYDIFDIKGVTDKQVEIIAKDVLIRTYNRKSQYPVASTGELLSDITDSETSATLTPSGIGNSEYASSGTLSIGKEAMTFTRSGDVLTLTRAQWGTEAKSHKADDTVQEAIAWNLADLDVVLTELLVTGAGLASSYIPTSEWDIEQEQWFQGVGVTGILMKPESIEKVIAELSESFMFDIWSDATTQTIKLKALAPEGVGETLNTFSEGNNIKQDSLSIDRRSKERYTEVRVYYNKEDFSEGNNIENFGSLQISSNVELASSDLFDGNTVKTIFSRWFDDGATALQLSGRMMQRFSKTPEYVTFDIDYKDHGSLEMAGRLELDSWQFVDQFGANEDRKFQVLEINEVDPGHELRVKCLTSSFEGRYWFIAANSTPDYSSATDQQKLDNAFICNDSGFFDDGTEAYKII